MSFHLGRHTFATAVTLKNGVPIETVSKMLGHKKITTTQIYAEVDEAKIAGDMVGIEERLENIRFGKRVESNLSNNNQFIINKNRIKYSITELDTLCKFSLDTKKVTSPDFSGFCHFFIQFE
jgi:hypothetical protein